MGRESTSRFLGYQIWHTTRTPDATQADLKRATEPY